MRKSEPIFSCYGCGANYKIVTIEVPTMAQSSKMSCEHCGAPLPSIEGNVFFKYVPVRRPKRI
jgi:hypothetical protein